MSDVVGVSARRERTRSSASERELCHDLKQPVAAMLVIASETALLGDDQLGETARHRLRQIEAQAKLLIELIDATLDPVPAGADGATSDLDAVLATVVAMVRVTSASRVVMVPGARAAHVGAAAPQLRRVFGNVLGNAVRAAGADGTVTVRSRRSAGRVVVEVDDEGPGWGHGETGHGLGLAVVLAAMDSVGGDVSAGRSPAGGSRVRLRFPLAAGAA